MLILSQDKNTVFETTGATIKILTPREGERFSKIVGYGNHNPSDMMEILGIYGPYQAIEVLCTLFEHIQTEFSGYVMPESIE